MTLSLLNYRGQGFSGTFGLLISLCFIRLSLIFISTSQVDFQDVNARTPVERKREEEKQRRLDRIYRERSEQAVREMQGESLGPGQRRGATGGQTSWAESPAMPWEPLLVGTLASPAPSVVRLVGQGRGDVGPAASLV